MRILSMVPIVVLFCSLNGFALSPKTPGAQVIGFKAEISVMRGMMVAAELAQSPDALRKAEQGRDDQKAQLEKSFKPAVVTAKTHPDLVKAIKGCYIAAQSFLDGAFPYDAAGRLQKKRLESDLDRCQNELSMEMQLAGIPEH